MKNVSFAVVVLLMCRIAHADAEVREAATKSGLESERRWLVEAKFALPGLVLAHTSELSRTDGASSVWFGASPSYGLGLQYLVSRHVSVGVSASLTSTGASANAVTSNMLVFMFDPSVTFRFSNRTFDGLFVTLHLPARVSETQFGNGGSSGGGIWGGIGLGLRGGYSHALTERFFVSASVGGTASLEFTRSNFRDETASSGSQTRAASFSLDGTASLGMSF